MSDTVRVNNLLLSWKSCIFKLDNDVYIGVQSQDFEQKRDRKIVFAGRRDGRPLGKTGGKYEPQPMKIVVVKDTSTKIKQYLADKAGAKSYGDAEFTWQTQYVAPGSDPVTNVFTGCTLDGVKDGPAEGNDELTEELTISFLDATENGLSLYSDEEES